MQNITKCRLLTGLTFIGPMLIGCRSTGGLVPNPNGKNTTRVVSPLVPAADELSSATPPVSHGDLISGPNSNSEDRISLSGVTPSTSEARGETAAASPQLLIGTFDDIADPTSQSQTANTSEGKTASETLSAAELDDSPSIDKRPSQLVVSGVRPGIGEVKVAIFTDAKSFPQPHGASQVFSMKSDGPLLELPIQPEQTFAVAVYQDLNGDGVLSRNRLGIPLEPFAFSNNAIGKRGPPTFAEAKIDVPRSTTETTIISIKLP